MRLLEIRPARRDCTSHVFTRGVRSSHTLGTICRRLFLAPRAARSRPCRPFPPARFPSLAPRSVTVPARLPPLATPCLLPSVRCLLVPRPVCCMPRRVLHFVCYMPCLATHHARCVPCSVRCSRPLHAFPRYVSRSPRAVPRVMSDVRIASSCVACEPCVHADLVVPSTCVLLGSPLAFGLGCLPSRPQGSADVCLGVIGSCMSARTCDDVPCVLSRMCGAVCVPSSRSLACPHGRSRARVPSWVLRIPA